MTNARNVQGFIILKQRLSLPEGRKDTAYEAWEQSSFLFITRNTAVTHRPCFFPSPQSVNCHKPTF